MSAIIMTIMYSELHVFIPCFCVHMPGAWSVSPSHHVGGVHSKEHAQGKIPSVTIQAAGLPKTKPYVLYTQLDLGARGWEEYVCLHA